MTVRRLTVKDFQRHRRKVLLLDPLTTTVVGPNGSGKTACVRALKAVALNRAGLGLVRHGADRFKVSLDLDGHAVRRVRGPKDNTYRLDGVTFKAFGREVPAPVRQVVNLAEESVQGQQDPPFWLTLSAGEVARELNRIVDLEVVDRVTLHLDARVRQVQAEEQVLVRQAEEAAKAVDALAWVPRFVRHVRRLEAKEQDLASVRHKRSLLGDLLALASRHSAEAKLAGDAATEGDKLVDTARRLRKLRAKKDRLAELLTKAKDLQALVGAPVPDMSELDEVRARADAAAERRRTLEMHLDQARRHREEAARWDDLAGKAEKELKRLTKGLCPVCQRPMPTG